MPEFDDIVQCLSKKVALLLLAGEFTKLPHHNVPDEFEYSFSNTKQQLLNELEKLDKQYKSLNGIAKY
jgi:hypothetical protein